METKDWMPSELDMKALDLEAAGPFDSPLLDLGRFRSFHVNGIVTETGTTSAGSCSLQILLYAKDGTTLLDTIDLLTAIVTTTSGAFSVAFGRDFAAAENGLGTIGATLGHLRAIGKAKLRILNGTPATTDGSVLLDVHLRAAD